MNLTPTLCCTKGDDQEVIDTSSFIEISSRFSVLDSEYVYGEGGMVIRFLAGLSELGGDLWDVVRGFASEAQVQELASSSL